MLFKTSILALAALAAAGPDKPAMNPGLNRNGLKQGLLDNLHPMHSTWEYWEKGWLPQSCRDIAKDHGLNPADFTVFNVHYDDCSAAWTFCRHKDSGADEISMIDIFGRMPVTMRGFIRYVRPMIPPYTLLYSEYCFAMHCTLHIIYCCCQ